MGDSYQSMRDGDLEDEDFRSSNGAVNAIVKALQRMFGPGPVQTVVARFRVLLERLGVAPRTFFRGLIITVAVIVLIVIVAVTASDGTGGAPGGLGERAAKRKVAENNENIFFNAHHSPIGAFASFTLGQKGQNGGLGLGLAGPANQDVYIMLESAEDSHMDALPFFPVGGPPLDHGFFSQMGTQRHAIGREGVPMYAYPNEDIRRDFQLGTDTWTARDLTFKVYSQVRGIPDPSKNAESDMKIALVPAVLAEIKVDNRLSAKTRRVVFGYSGSDPYSNMRLVSTASGSVGVGQGLETAILTDHPGASTLMGFSIQDIVDKFNIPAKGGGTREMPSANRTFALGNSAAIIIDAPPMQLSTFSFVICFYKGGPVTSGMPSTYFYTKYFPHIEAVAEYAFNKWEDLTSLAESSDHLLDSGKTPLNDHQKFQMRHAIRAYYGSTQLLDQGDAPHWVVNEGEYRMMNTFDLTIDQLFFELRMNPWTVRNVLDTYVRRYSYTDTVVLPGDPFTEYPGGLSFTHDQGVANAFSPPGRSAYEGSGLTGLFSQMTHEQLVNWVLCAAVYVARVPEDDGWLSSSLGVFRSALNSLKNRDHPDPTKRDGIMSADTSRTMGGSEITTYDSLDTSLGQARDNLYLGGKTWAAYVLLEKVFIHSGKKDLAEEAATQADLAAATMGAAISYAGYIPAIITDKGAGARIIPAIEGLVYPLFGGAHEALAVKGRYQGYLGALQRHLSTVLHPGVCLFPDGGWKLSSTSDNSWLSKIYLSQFVAHEILHMARDEAAEAADAAHASWLKDPRNSYWGWSDQMIEGEAVGSRYYPRGVTSILWLEYTPNTE